MIALNRRRVMGGGSPLPILPDGYTQVKALRSTGAYINLGKMANINYQYYIEGDCNEKNNWLWGNAVAQGSPSSLGVNSSTIRFSTAYTRSINIISGIHEVTIDKKGYQIDDNYTAWGSQPTSLTATINLLLHKATSSSLVPDNTIYRFYIKDTNTDEYIMDLYPCVRESDGVAGYYDVVQQVFLAPVGGELEQII